MKRESVLQVCIFDAWHPEGGDPDDPLINSHWIALETIARLREADLGVEHVSGASFDRADVRAAVADGAYAGFMYFGHGREHVLYRDTQGPQQRPIPLLAIEDLLAIRRRFFVAFACLSGQELGMAAPSAGVGAYLGYRVPISVNWTLERLPADLVAMLSDLTTQGSCLVATGERSRSVVRARVRELSDRILDHLDRESLEHDADQWGLVLLATSLHRDLVLEGVDVAS